MAKKRKYEFERGSYSYSSKELDLPRKKKTNPVKERRGNNKIWIEEQDLDEEWYDAEEKYRF